MNRKERQQALADERRINHELLVKVGDDELIRVWHSSTPTRLLAIRFGVSTTSLIIEWRRLQRANLLPLTTRQQRDSDEGGNDGRPKLATDPLLDRLRKYHKVES